MTKVITNFGILVEGILVYQINSSFLLQCSPPFHIIRTICLVFILKYNSLSDQNNPKSTKVNAFSERERNILSLPSDKRIFAQRRVG